MPTTDLSKYVSKRDFSKTAEPGGESTVAPSTRLRFVIQKHAARRLHYDLRLELDGVFKSWAVTRGPSLDPKDRRLAVEVEDHPLAYGDFEGTIPRGEYGGGSVQLWDHGYWTPEGGAAPQAALQSGDLKFQLEGQRLHGSWVLVRIKNDRTGGKRTNWLLIKHRDSWSHEGDADALLAEDRSVASGRAMAEIASGKGRGPKPFMLATRKSAKADAVWNSNRGGTAQLPASVQSTADDTPEKAHQKSSQATRIATKPPPDFIEPQLCRVAGRPPTGKDWVHEVKFDGYRLQLRIQNGRTSLRTRKGLDWTRKFPAIARAAVDLPDAIIDGEVVAIDSRGAPDFAALQAALSDGATDNLIFYAFDLLFADGHDLRELPLAERKNWLRNFLNARRDDASPIRYVEHMTASGYEVLAAAREMGLEGIVSKRLDAPYRSGRTNASWLKVKCRAGQEFVIGAWTDTAGQFRSLLVGVPRDGHLAYIGRVGTGFGQDVVTHLMPRLKAVTVAKNPFGGDNTPREQSNVHWVKPELVAEVEFANWTADRMLRAASFKGLREDKSAAEIVIERAAPAEHAVKTEVTNSDRTAKRKSVDITPVRQSTAYSVVMGVTISNPEKAMWPDAGDGKPVTKLDLAHYYEAVGSWMIGHLKGRPCSIIRAPDGIGGDHFFQRHAMPGTSKLLELVNVADDRKSYLQSIASKALRRSRRSRGSSYIHGIASRGIPTYLVDWCSISIQRRTSILPS